MAKPLGLPASTALNPFPPGCKAQRTVLRGGQIGVGGRGAGAEPVGQGRQMVASPRTPWGLSRSHQLSLQAAALGLRAQASDPPRSTLLLKSPEQMGGQMLGWCVLMEEGEPQGRAGLSKGPEVQASGWQSREGLGTGMPPPPGPQPLVRLTQVGVLGPFWASLPSALALT